MSFSAPAHYQRSKELSETDPFAALKNISFGIKQDADYLPFYSLSKEILEGLDAEMEASLFDAVVKNPLDAEAYNELGKFYFQNEDYAFAIAFFQKSLKIAANSSVEHDMAICYARDFQVDKALEILEASSANDFWHFYFLNKCRILNNQTEAVQETIDILQDVLKKVEEDNDATIVAKDKVNELQEMLSRLNVTPSPRQHIRDWHFIQQGSMVLNFFEKEDESDENSLGGRYVALWHSNENVLLMAKRLNYYLQQLEIKPQQIISIDDRDAIIFGTLVAKILDLPFKVLKPEIIYQHSLIIASETEQLEYIPGLEKINHQNMVFVYHHNWLMNAMISPDIIGLMAQSFTYPWNGGIKFQEEEGIASVIEIPKDERNAEIIAAEILQSSSSDEPLFIEDDLQFYIERKDFLKGIGTQYNTDRYNLLRESPVPATYFY